MIVADARNGAAGRPDATPQAVVAAEDRTTYWFGQCSFMASGSDTVTILPPAV